MADVIDIKPLWEPFTPINRKRRPQDANYAERQIGIGRTGFLRERITEGLVSEVCEVIGAHNGDPNGNLHLVLRSYGVNGVSELPVHPDYVSELAGRFGVEELSELKGRYLKVGYNHIGEIAECSVATGEEIRAEKERVKNMGRRY